MFSEQEEDEEHQKPTCDKNHSHNNHWGALTQGIVRWKRGEEPLIETRHHMQREG